MAIMEQLLQRGCEANVQDATGQTALTIVAEKGDAEGLSLLLAHGADVRVGRKDGIPALGLTARGGHLPTLRLLLGAGAMVDEPSGGEGCTALMLASRAFLTVYSRREEHDQILACIEELLARGADVNRLDVNGRSALFHVTAHRYGGGGLGKVRRGACHGRGYMKMVLKTCTFETLLDRHSDTPCLSWDGVHTFAFHRRPPHARSSFFPPSARYVDRSAQKRLVRWLVERGAELELRDRAGILLVDAADPAVAKLVRDRNITSYDDLIKSGHFGSLPPVARFLYIVPSDVVCTVIWS
jgi:hypothetical protein